MSIHYYALSTPGTPSVRRISRVVVLPHNIMLPKRTRLPDEPEDDAASPLTRRWQFAGSASEMLVNKDMKTIPLGYCSRLDEWKCEATCMACPSALCRPRFSIGRSRQATKNTSLLGRTLSRALCQALSVERFV